MVSRYQLLKGLSEIIPEDALVIASIGNNSGFWGQIREKETDLLNISMGMCTPTALGLALALPNRKVVALDADGNLLLNLGSLGTVANENPQNLIIIVFDNGSYLGSIKNQPGPPTATSGRLSLEAVAKGSGISSSSTVHNFEDFLNQVKLALSSSGLHFIVAKIGPLDFDAPPRTERAPDTKENKYRFANYIQRTEGAKILGSGLGKYNV